MTREKLRNGEWVNIMDEELQSLLWQTKLNLQIFNSTILRGVGYEEALTNLIPGIPATSFICPQFWCDYGDGIKLEKHVFVNYGCVFLDGGDIHIGAYTRIGPSVQIYTIHHPMNYIERRKGLEKASPVSIGEDCWIGGGAIICPGVTIGDRCIIGAGSVVTKDLPSDVVAVGNPARAQ
ncbi:MAG: sugar O-acetyltransferase [Bacteroidales bacterium]|nr:sugar O-acetyltransferase [Bacteroidales bacterium]